MTRLIDADALKADIKWQINLCIRKGMGKFAKVLADGLYREVDKQPTVDAVPVRHGRWIHHSEVKNIYGGKCIECSECGEKYVCMHIEDEKYCRNCGAKMDARKEE